MAMALRLGGPKFLQGLRVEKKFGARTYQGRVVEYLAVCGKYKVLFEGGDSKVWARVEVLEQQREVDDDCFEQQETVSCHSCKTPHDEDPTTKDI